MDWIKIKNADDIPQNTDLLWKFKNQNLYIPSTLIDDMEMGLVVSGWEDYLSLDRFSHYMIIENPNT